MSAIADGHHFTNLMANTKITVNLSKDVVTLQLIANKETTMVDVLQAAMVKVTDMADKVVLTEVMVVKADMVLVTTEDMVVTVADMVVTEVVTVVVMVEDMVAMAAMVLVTTDVMEAMVAMEVTVGTLAQVQFTSMMMKIVVAMAVIVIVMMMTIVKKIGKKTKIVEISVGDMFDASIRKTNYLNNFLSII